MTALDRIAEQRRRDEAWAKKQAEQPKGGGK